MSLDSESEAEIARVLRAIRDGATADSIETELLDFKEDPTRRGFAGETVEGEAQNDDAAMTLADAAGCMANGEGGLIVVGIADNIAGPEAILGCSLEKDWLRARIRELAEPPLTLRIEETEELGKRLLILKVPRNAGSEPHAVKVSRGGGRRTSHRVGTQCQELVGLAEMMTWSTERQNYDWSAAVSHRRIEDVRSAALDAIREVLVDTGEPDRVTLAQAEDGEMLSRLQLLRPDGNLNKAGELLCCASASPNIIYIHRENPGQPSRSKVELSGRGLVEEFTRVLEAIDLANPSMQLLGSEWPTRGIVDALPKPALREALVNAMMHRDWSLGEPITVEHVGNELIVQSPGGFFGGVSAETVLTAQSKTRNRVLGDAFRSLRLAEREGTGVDRIFVEMIQLGHPKPEFAERDGGVRVSLRGGIPVPEVLAAQSVIDPKIRGTARLAVALDFLRSRPSFSKAELAEVAQEQESMLDDFLAQAEADEVLVRTKNPRPGGAASWRLHDRIRGLLGPVLPYYARPQGESIELIVQLARDQGSVRNADVQDLLGVNSPRASQLLAAAKDAGRVSPGPDSSSRGRNVYFVAVD